MKHNNAGFNVTFIAKLIKRNLHLWVEFQLVLDLAGQMLT